ncbi:DUF2255 family protein [Pseudolysinimonas sp.]|jgi:hypothetical protein|uniref:DUF2255 family protein n=1 Tax=Pseudolysinimonas sp. TaxID=2680009 RepID=UPI00378306FD
MSDFTRLAEHLGATDTVTIITTRPNGDEVATPIWSTAVDGIPYVRAAYGPRTSWYLRARSGRPVAFTTTDGRGAERDAVAALADPRVGVSVVHLAPDAAEQDAVDEAFRAKYAHSPYVESVAAAPVRALTLRIAASLSDA